jgi:MoaA/NifB/PqqE/SkfB family radical SAM enzyme
VIHFQDLRIRAAERSPKAIFKRASLKLLQSWSSTRAPYPPSHIQLELTTRCNLRCIWCSLSDPEYRKEHTGDMPLPEVLRLLPQLKGSKVLLLYGLGEPLVYKGLEEVIAEARKHVPCVCFTTNGVLLTKERSQSLAEAGLSRIHLSLNSLDAEFVKKVNGSDLNAILDNIGTFSRTTDLPVRIWAVVCRENIEQLHRLVELKDRIPTLEYLHFQLATGAKLLDKHNISSVILAEQMTRFKQQLRELCRARDIATDVRLLPDKPLVSPRQDICPAPWTGTVYINVQGYLTPCCILRGTNLENVFEVGFRAAWNGGRMQDFRGEILKGEYLPGCCNWCGYCTGENN